MPTISLLSVRSSPPRCWCDTTVGVREAWHIGSGVPHGCVILRFPDRSFPVAQAASETRHTLASAHITVALATHHWHSAWISATSR